MKSCHLIKRSARLSKLVLAKTHLFHNKSHRILLYSYIRHCAACHRFDNCLCYTLAFRAMCKDKYHRKTRPVSVATFMPVFRSYRTDVNKNSNLSSFPLDSFQGCMEVEPFFVFVFARRLLQSKGKASRLRENPFSFRTRFFYVLCLLVLQVRFFLSVLPVLLVPLF